MEEDLFMEIVGENLECLPAGRTCSEGKRALGTTLNLSRVKRYLKHVYVAVGKYRFRICPGFTGGALGNCPAFSDDDS